MCVYTYKALRSLYIYIYKDSHKFICMTDLKIGQYLYLIVKKTTQSLEVTNRGV